MMLQDFKALINIRCHRRCPHIPGPSQIAPWQSSMAIGAHVCGILGILAIIVGVELGGEPSRRAARKDQERKDGSD